MTERAHEPMTQKLLDLPTAEQRRILRVLEVMIDEAKA